MSDLQSVTPPLESHEFDLVVVGGGLAGVAAAIAAARAGTKTALIQDRPVPGGNSSSEIRVIPFGAANFSTWARETGIMEEILLEDRATNHVDFFEHGLVNTHYDLVLLELLRREPKLSLFFNTVVRAVETHRGASVDAQRIQAVIGSQLASEREYRFAARQFIDCTGDGTVGVLAGAKFRYGREARAEFEEPMAPQVADTVTMGSTLTMRAVDTGRPVAYCPPPWVKIYRTEEEIGPKRKVTNIKRPTYGGYWWLEVSDPPYHQIHDNAGVRDELLSHVLGVWNYIKNHSPSKEIARTYALDWIGMIPGKRESRRLVGDVVVTEHDVHHDRQWPDRVCCAGWTIDLHIKGGILNKQDPGELSFIDEHYNHYIRTVPFTLPLRAFYSCKVDNLWMAGRNISVTHVALGATRVQQTHANQGEAVGLAASYALKHGLTPRQTADPGQRHVAEIQQQILRNDVHILGVQNHDANDLARTAFVTATSDAPLDLADPVEGRSVALDRPRAMIFPVTAERVEAIEVFLCHSGEESRIVRGVLCEVETIWDKEPRASIAEAEVSVPPGFAGWVTFNLQATTRASRSFRFELHGGGAHVTWRMNRFHPVGTTAQFEIKSPGGPEMKNRHVESLSLAELDLPPYQRWIQDKRVAYAMRITPCPTPYTAPQVVNGVAHPECMPNLWISDPRQPLPQSLELRFADEQLFDTVHLAFDTNLNLHYTRFGALWRAPMCARDWLIEVERGGQWKEVCRRMDNYQRRCVVQFEPVTAVALRLTILASNREHAATAPGTTPKESDHPTEGSYPPDNMSLQMQGDSARLYEIRVYHSRSQLTGR